MKKVKFRKYWSKLGIVEFSRPFSFGYLNTQLVVLLSALGVPNELFALRHQENLDCITGLTCDVIQALKYLIFRSHWNIVGMA